MAFHCLQSRGVAEMEYTYSGFCACVLILWHGHGVLKFFSSLMRSVFGSVLTSSFIYLNDDNCFRQMILLRDTTFYVSKIYLIRAEN